MPKYLDDAGLAHFWENARGYVDDSTKAISGISHVELATKNAEPSGQTDGSLLLDQNVLEVDATVGGARTGWNTGLCTNVNNYGNRGINIGLSQGQAAADFVANSVLMLDVPYTHLYSRERIVSVSASSIKFTQDASDYVSVGNVLWLTESMERSPSDYQTPMRKYDDLFVYQTYAATVTEVSGDTVTVGAWYELPWTGNETPSGTATPTLGSGMNCYVNPLNGLYAHYDLMRVPSSAPNGYKLYHSQTHVYNDCDEAVYSNGDVILFESGTNGYGFSAKQISSGGRLEAAFHGAGYTNYLVKGDYNDQLPSYRRSIETVGLTTGGVLQGDCLQVENNDTSQMQTLLTRTNTVKYQPGILRIAKSQTIDVDAFLPNAEYKLIIVGSVTLTINNDSDSQILPVSTNAQDTRLDVPAGGSVTIARSTSRSAHNMIRLMYVVPPRQTDIGSYPDTTIRDLVITIDAATPSDYTFTAS